MVTPGGPYREVYVYEEGFGFMGEWNLHGVTDEADVVREVVGWDNAVDGVVQLKYYVNLVAVKLVEVDKGFVH